MRKALCIIGAGLIIGGTAAIIYLLSNKKKKHDTCHDFKEPEKKQSSVMDAPLTRAELTREEPVYENAKKSAIGSMYSRHEGAAAIMRDSVETIHENVKISENTNNEIDKVSAELDKMLSED